MTREPGHALLATVVSLALEVALGCGGSTAASEPPAQPDRARAPAATERAERAPEPEPAPEPHRNPAGMTIRAVAIIGITAAGEIGGAMTSIERGGRCSSTIRTPVAGGRFLGEIHECVLHGGPPGALFDELEGALPGVQLAPWTAEQPTPRYLRGATTLVISDDHEAAWIAADAASLRALGPLVTELERRLRRDPTQ